MDTLMWDSIQFWNYVAASLGDTQTHPQADGATDMTAWQLMPSLGNSISGKEGPGGQEAEQTDKTQGTLSIPGHPQLAALNPELIRLATWSSSTKLVHK